MKKQLITFISLLLTVLISINAVAFGGDDKDPKSKKEDKETKKTKAQPDVPGAFVIDIANNIFQNAPDEMKLNAWGSWTANIYYQYEFPIGNSNFSFNAGIGLGLEKYSFNNNVTLITSNDDSQTLVESLDNILPDATSIKKTNFAANYIDFPISIRFNADKINRRKSFKASVGGKLGVRYGVHTKVKFEENSQVKKFKSYENYNIPNFRYGLFGKVGLAGVSLYYYYSLTEFFDNKKGPDETQANVMMFGLSFSGF